MKLRATAPVLRYEYPDRCGDYGANKVWREKGVSKGEGDGGKKRFGTHPAPKAQWSRSIASGSLLDSSEVNESPRKRSGLNVNLWRDVQTSALKGVKWENVGAYGSGYLSSL